MNQLKLFLLATISFLGMSTSDVFATRRSVKKAAIALQKMAHSYNQFTDTDQVNDYSVTHIRSKFRLTGAEWNEAVHLRTNSDLSAMEIINRKIKLVHCQYCTQECIVHCSSIPCNICRHIKFLFEVFARNTL